MLPKKEADLLAMCTPPGPRVPAICEHRCRCTGHTPDGKHLMKHPVACCSDCGKGHSMVANVSEHLRTCHVDGLHS